MGEGEILRLQPTYRLLCGKCGGLDDAVMADTKRDAERAFRDMGCTKTKDHGWLCSACTKERGASG